MVDRRLRLGAILTLVLLSLSVRTSALPPGIRLDWEAPEGANYDHAEFRLWRPDPSQPGAARPIRGVLVLMPGSNEDGRGLVEDPHWQAFAERHDMALLGCWFSDKPHPQMFFENYADAARGSGQALLDALTAFSAQVRRPELATVPLLLWGMSAGGQFNYEFVAWKPERVAGFIVNKGGVYYSALLSAAARQVPGLFFIGGKDLETRQQAIRGLFAMNRRGGAFWAFIEEPTMAHVIGRSREIATMYFDELIPSRFAPPSPTAPSPGLLPLAEASGFIGDPKSFTTRKAGTGTDDDAATATSWLPTQHTARLWEAASKDQQLP
jgi:pimeloyl-ACP methyl ester carboxylesterase